jgi:hypothetical protein
MELPGKNQLNLRDQKRRIGCNACVLLDAAPALAHLEGMTICKMTICKLDSDHIRCICITC